MNALTNKPLHLPLWAGGIAAILIGGIAISTMAISANGAGDVLAPLDPPAANGSPAVAAPAARAYRCAECGVIESTRKIEIPYDLIRAHAPGGYAAGNRAELEAKQAQNYLITIRLQNGSTRLIADAHSANWRPGERVSLIGGVEQAGR